MLEIEKRKDETKDKEDNKYFEKFYRDYFMKQMSWFPSFVEQPVEIASL